ncbi:MAG: RNA polymerase sigma factor [Planctomycetota bacterium]
MACADSNRDESDRRAVAAALDHWPRLHGFAAAITKDSTRADDLCQTAYLRLLERANTIDFDRPVLPLLLTIVQREAASEARRARPQPLPADDGERGTALVADSGGEPSELAEIAERRVDIRTALETLPDSWRAALYLKDGLGCSYREIGEVIDASSDTVRTMLHRARRRLRALWTERTARQ